MIATPEQLYTEHGPQLLAWARKFSRTQEDAEDSLQSAFLKIVGCWPPRELRYALTWAYAVVRNQCLDLRRKQLARGLGKDLEIETLSFGVREALARVVSHEGAVIASVSIAEASRRLNALERDCVVALVHGERRTAGATSTRKVQLSRTRNKLRRLIR